MKRRLTLLTLVLFLSIVGVKAQNIVAKHNLAYDALLTPNFSIEFAMGKKWTLDTQLGMNSFLYETDATSPDYKEKKFSHWMIQPEVRYWTCEKFNGWFLGAHLMGLKYNVGKMDIPFILSKGDANMKEHRYEGMAYGGGISAGYQWVLSKRWNFEASLGLGYLYIDYDKFPCATCGVKTDSGKANYLGPTKATVSLVYVFK